MATFANIIPPTKHSPPVATDAQLWNLLSHLHVNLMPNLSADALKEILTLHALPNDTDIARKLSNSRRISAIESTSSKMETTFIRGLPISGSKIELTVDSGGFASRGDLRLFGDVIEQLFGMYHHINAYCKLTIIEKNTREVMSWPPRLGLKRLL
jgi:type VI secretion system protein ImpG